MKFIFVVLFDELHTYDGVRRVLGLRRERFLGGPPAYLCIQLKSRLRPSRKSSVWVNDYFKLFTTQHRFLQAFFSVGYSGPRRKLRVPHVIPRPGAAYPVIFYGSAKFKLHNVITFFFLFFLLVKSTIP